MLEEVILSVGLPIEIINIIGICNIIFNEVHIFAQEMM